MKKLPIEPIRNRIDIEEKDQAKELDLTLSILIGQFKNQALKGKIQFKTANDFTKLVNSYLVLQQAIKANQTSEDAYDTHLNSLIDEDDPIVQEMYQMLFTEINDANDEKNKEVK